jgi:hypothetical protein
MQKQDELKAKEQAQVRDQALLQLQQAEKARRLESVFELNRSLEEQMEDRKRIKRLSAIHDRKYAESVHRSVARVEELERFQQLQAQESKRLYQQQLLAQMQAKRQSFKQAECLSLEELRINQAQVLAARSGALEASSFQSPVRQRRRQALTPSPLASHQAIY